MFGKNNRYEQYRCIYRMAEGLTINVSINKLPTHTKNWGQK